MGRATVAIAHDYLTQRGGAERVVLAMSEAFPDAPIYTTLYDRDSTFPEFATRRVITSPINHVAAFRRDHRRALPVLATASSAMHIPADVVICSTSGWAHGFSTEGIKYVYCHTPARWLYLPEQYLGEQDSHGAFATALRVLTPMLKRWDQRAARSADFYAVNSTVVRERVRRVYGMDSEVFPAPLGVDLDGEQSPIGPAADWPDFHLVVSRLMPYKNVGAVLDAFRDLPEEHLLVIGTGPLAQQLRHQAPGNVVLAGRVEDSQMRWAYHHAKALVAASHEDYGLTPLEAAAAGVPTIALHGGGYLDTVDPQVSGVFFEQPRAGDIRAGVLAARQRDWDRRAIAGYGRRFSPKNFIERLRREVSALL